MFRNANKWCLLNDICNSIVVINYIEEMSQTMGILNTGALLKPVVTHFNVSHKVIKRVRMDFNDTGSVEHRHGGERNRNSQRGPCYCGSMSKEQIFYCKNTPNAVIECNKYLLKYPIKQ